MAMLTSTAIREGGILLQIPGRYCQPIRITMQTTPTITACQLVVWIKSNTAFNLSMVSIRGSWLTTVSPRKSLICPTKIVTAIPAVKPVVMV